MIAELISLVIKSIAVAVSILLIVRSVVSIPGLLPTYSGMKMLFGITELFVRPMRSVLPRELWKNGVDYASLVSALIVLFVGFGLISFVNIIFTGLIK
ncbi:YggT family protein [Candidatus Latescibacterota bacterium]